MPLPSEINLAPSQQFSKTNILDKIYIWGGTAGKTIIIITNFIIISIWLYRWDLDRRIYNLATSIEEKQLAITSISKKEETIRKIQEKLSFIKNIEDNKIFYSELLNKFDKSNTQGIIINRISFPLPNTLNISAQAINGTVFGTYIDRLIKDATTQDLTLFGSTYNSTDKSYTFVLEIEYK